MTTANFQTEVLDSPLPVLVDFWGEHCEPCKRLLPVLSQLAEEMAGRAKIGKADIASQMTLANRYRVRSLPTLLIFKNGEVRDQFVGSNFTKDQLRAKLEAAME